MNTKLFAIMLIATTYHMNWTMEIPNEAYQASGLTLQDDQKKCDDLTAQVLALQGTGDIEDANVIDLQTTAHNALIAHLQYMHHPDLTPSGNQTPLDIKNKRMSIGFSIMNLMFIHAIAARLATPDGQQEIAVYKKQKAEEAARQQLIFKRGVLLGAGVLCAFLLHNSL